MKEKREPGMKSRAVTRSSSDTFTYLVVGRCAVRTRAQPIPSPCGHNITSDRSRFLLDRSAGDKKTLV